MYIFKFILIVSLLGVPILAEDTTSKPNEAIVVIPLEKSIAFIWAIADYNKAESAYK